MLTEQEKKNLQRRFSQVEKEINSCEVFIKEKEVQLADSGFYQSTDFQKEVKAYENKKVELEKLVVEWESLVEKISNS
jgi:predicted  nucleic acid-binding Zn-ribbon protein